MDRRDILVSPIPVRKSNYMRLDSFTKNSLIMFAASSLGSFFNLFYQLVMVRVVPKEVFASLNSLLSLLIIISVPCASFVIMVTKHISSHKARNNDEELRAVWRKLAGHAFWFSLAVALLIIAFRVNIASFLRLDSSGGIVILAFIFFFSGLSTVITGGLQGLERFKWLAFITVGAGLLKLFLSFVLVKMVSNSLNTALAGFLLPSAFGVILGLWPLRMLLKRKEVKEVVDIKKLYRYILPATAVALCFSLFTNMDMLLVKHFFAAGAQDYAVAQMVGKIILSIAGVIYVVMFSRVSHMHALREDSRKILRRSLIFTFGLSVLVTLGYNLFPGLALKLLAGRSSPEIILLGRLFSLSMLFYALSNVLFYYQLSVEKYGFIQPLLIAAAVQITAIAIFHQTVVMVGIIVVLSSLSIFLVNLKSALAYEKPQGQGLGYNPGL